MTTDISERTAGLNTQMRFGNYRAALSLAYRLRLDLQLSQPSNVKTQRELESVESVIEQLERLKISRFQRWAQRFWESIVESFHPPEQAQSLAEHSSESKLLVLDPSPPAEETPKGFLRNDDTGSIGGRGRHLSPLDRQTPPDLGGPNP
jgi:hypothetical protein